MVVSMAMGVPPNGLFIRENAIEMDDLGVPLFQEIYIHKYIMYTIILLAYHIIRNMNARLIL